MKHTVDECNTGLSRSTLQTIGLVFAACGVISRGILQNGILGMGRFTPQQLLEAMDAAPEMMVIATIALILQAFSTCAVPIFACLLVDRFITTSNFSNDLIRLFGLAVISEFTYNYAMAGRFIDLTGRNPAFGLLVGLIVLYFYHRYQGKNVLIKILVTAAAIGWCIILRIDEGIPLMLLICVLWMFQKNQLYRNFIGASAAAVCSFMSPFYLASPMGFLVVHLYHGKRGAGSQWAPYAAYPILLVLAGITSALVRG